ncbi:hypothetical protein JG687_00009878 [Phytophthora cactorum]|uniref:DEP domain-containing protein n=1 Tax=Phytophthora cactorum TaxID=29920 RepID=A0A8T1UAH0_9STRA|nr:hypothetical protein JG687_00009878 [Phytophthora cactorum]
MQDEPPPPPPPPPVDSRSRSLSSNPAVPGPLRAGGRAPTFSELRASGLSSRSSSLHVDVKDDDPLSPRTRLEMEKQRQAMGKTTATSSGLNTSAANTSNTTPTNHSSTRSTPRSSSFYSVSSSLEFAPTGGRRFDLQTQHRNPSNQLSPHRAMLSRVDSLLGSQPPSGPSPGASSQYGGASFVATHSMYSASSTSTSPSLATSTRTFHRERGEEQREPSSCGAEILYNSPIRLRLSSRQCLRISAVKDSNHQSHATSHFPPRPTGSGTGTGGSAGIARTSRPLTTVQINVSGDGLDGDADQIFVLQNTALRSDCGEVHYSDIVSLYCVGGSCKGQFLSVDPATQTLTMKKGPVISNSEKWRLVNPISEGREDYPVNNQDSFASVDAASRLWGQQKAIATSDSVMLKMNTAELYLSVRPDRYGQDDSAGTHTASVVLSKENDGINDTMQVWKVTKSNLPYDPEWNRERPYLTGEAFVQPQAKRHHTADDGDLNLPPLSTYPPSVQESIIVDDLLYVLLGVEGRYIKLAVTETRGVDAARSTRTFKFGLNQPGMDPSLLTLASRCLSLGEFYLNLSLYIEQFSRYEYGQVSHAFCAALKTLVKEYKIMVGQLEHLTRNADGAAPFTIQKLWYNVQPSLRTLEMLSLLVDGCHKTIGGGSLLSEIQRIMSSLAGDSNARKVFSFLMERASVPYLKMVERWIYHGDLVDPYDEFMIRRDDQVSKEDVQDNPYSTYWQSRYTIRASQVPLFLSRVAQKILTAGKYLNVFRTCSRQVDCPFAGEIVFSPSESVYEELIDKAHGFASRVLLDLFVRENDLQNRLISLKHYFLMDQGDFFVDFMDVAEVELKLRADKLSLPRLESLLHLSLQTSTCSSDPYKDDLQCFLSPHNLISHMEAIHQRAQKGPRDSLTTFESSSIGHPGYKVIDAFTLDYNVKWPLSLVISCGALTKYQMIFRHIFFCKHVERQLCDAWMNHQATKELSLRAALGPSFCLRQRMLHFQQNFVYYMMFEVISPRWHDFQQQLASAGTVDDILEFQGEFLDICLKECLLTDPELLRVLTRLMMVCMTFANSIESYTRPYFLDEETIKAEREAERDRRAEKKAREEAEVALASYQRQKGTFGGKKKGGVLRRRQSSQVDMRRTRIRELSDDVKRALTEREGDEENPFVRMTNDLENQFDSLLGEFMQQLLRRSLLQQNSHLSNLCTRLDYNGFYTKSRPKILNQIFICKRIWRAQYTCVLLVAVCLLLLGASAKQLTVLVQPLTSTAGESLSVQPVLALTDDNGNILTTENDGTVIVSIGNNPSRFAGIYPLASAFTFENGIARCSGLYINEANVGFTLVFSSYYHGVRTETSSFDVVVGPRYRLAILADISTAYGGTPFLPQPTAGVVDKGGNVVAAVTESSVRIEIEVNPVGGVLQPAALLNVSIVGGIARFRGAFIDVAGSPYKLRYTTDLVLDGGSTVVTNPFTVAAGECSRLQFNTTLGEATGGKAFLIQPVLKLLDSGGNVLEADSSSKVRVTIAANPSRGTLTPADGLTVRVQKGVATFRSLKIDKAGNGYSLQFTLYTKVQGKNTWKKTTISQVSDTFDILTGNPVSLLLQRNLSDGILDGQPNEIQPIVALLDSGGNVVSSLETGTVTASLVSSASVSSSIVVDTSAAPLLTVVNVRALINSAYPMAYGVGARVSVQVTFSDEVSIKGAPTLELESSANGAGANGKAVAVTTTTVWSSIYVFEYDVVATDNTLDLEYTSTTALSLNGGLITDRNGKTPILTLPALGSANSLAGTSAVVIDTTAPVITSVSCPTPGDGEYGTGQQINLSVQFSQPVSVYGNPLLPVALTSVSGTGGTRNAVFSSGNNTNTLVFIYTVQSGDAAAKLDVTASINVNGGFIKHCSQRPTTDAVVTMAAVPVKLSSVNNIVIDTATPTIDATVGVTSGTSNGIYAPGDEIKILITFTKPVTVTGYPRSGTKVLTLVYRVSAGDTAGNGFLNYRDDHALRLNGGTITRSLVGSTDEVALSGIMPPALKINTGTVVPYASGSSTRTLVFLHIVKNGEAIPGLDKFDDNAVICTAPNCQIINYNAQSADLSLTGISLEPANIVIDTSAPQIVSVYAVTTAPTVNGGSFVVGDVIEIVIKMDLEVFIEPPPSAYPEKAPVLLLNTVKGGKPVLCQGYANNDRHLLLFKYTVEPGDVATDLMHIDQSALTLNSGQSSIKRFSTTPTTNAVLTLPVPQPLGASLNVNGNKVPAVLSVSSPTANDLYRCGDQIALTVSFSQHVVVKGAPFLWLDMGAVPRKALYNTGSGTTVLTFIYTVQEGDYSVDMEYVDHHSLDSTISVNGSLSYNKNLQVNGRKPSIVATRFTSADGLYKFSDTGVLLTGYGAGLTVRTERDGQGRLSGFFRLQFRTDIFPNDETDDIPVGASDHDVEVALEKLVSVNDVNAKNDYGPVIDTSGNLPALVPVITKLKGTNARVVVQVGGYEPSSLSADSSSTNAGLPGGSAGMAAVFTRGNNDWKQQGGDHGDDSGNIPDLVVDSSALTKGAGVGSAQMHEYSAGTFRSDGSSAKGLQCGAAYIFTRDKKLSTWSEYTKFAPPAAQIADIREYGGAVALSDPFAVVGAPGAYNEAGRVFVYQFNGVDKWLLFQTLSAAPNVITSGDRFGESVAISGTVTTTVVVGAPGYASNSGAVFVFDLMGGYFQNRQMLMQVVPEMQPGDGFGNALDLDMLFTYTLVVAAHRHTYQRDGAVDAVKSGMVLVFVRRSSNDIFFVLQQVLYASDIRARDRFGTSIAVAKDTIIVGAHELYEGEQTTRKAVQALTASVLETEATNSIQGGSFTLSFLRSNAGEDPTKVTTIKRVETRAIAYDISSSGLQAILETDFDLTNVIVRRDGPSAYKGYTWYVTFAGSSGEIPLLEVDNTQLKGGEVTVKWINHLAPVLRGSAYVFTRDGSGKWTEQASFFPRKKQYFAWFGSAVAVHKRTAVIGAPNLDTYISGINSGGAFVGDLGILSVRFSAKTYNVLEGDSLDVTVQRCSRLGGFCAVDVSAAPQLYIEYDTGDAFSDRQSASTYVAVIPTIGPYRKLSSLDASGRQGSSSVFYAKDVMGQEPFPQVGNGRWLAGDAVGTANGRNQFYGSSERRSLWVDAIFDYAGTSDYSSSSGELFFDGVDDLTHTFSVQTTSDFVVENPDETVMMRLSLPGIWPSVTGDLWSTLTIKDNGDGGSGARSYLAHLNPEPSLAQAQSDFSRSVSIFNAGNAAAVGAPLERNNAGVKCGAVHLFVRRSGFWERDATVFPSDCVPGMLFGTSVAIDGSLGPAFSSTFIPDPTRQILISEVVAIGSGWKQQARLTAPDGNAGDQFGLNVGLSGEQAIVGAAGSSALTTTTWDFETGDLTGWLTTGTAFDQQPTYGDNSYGRTNIYRPSPFVGASPPGQRANHEGRYWVGTFEARPGAGKATTAAQVAAQMCAFANDELCRAPNYKMPTASASVGTTQGDGPQGTLTSLPFIIEGQWMSFRVGGGCDIRVVYVELLIDGQPAAVSESVAAEQVAVEVTADGASTPSPNNVRPITATSKLRATGRCRETMQEVTWDLSAFENRTAQIRVVDASSNLVWGHINFDDVRFSWGAARVAQTSTSKAGAAYTFRRRAPGTQFPTAKCEGMNRWTCEWEFQARLAASDKRSEDLFGSSVAVDDVLGVAVVAAPGQRGVDANNTIDRVLSDGLDISKEGLRAMEQVGSLYVFRRADEVRDGAGVLLRTPKWAPKEVLKMQYPQKQRQSHFGAALDLDGSDLIVGAPGISISPVLPQSGRAFAYDLAVAGIKFTNSWFACVEGNADGLVGLTLSRSAATSNLTRPLTIGYATEDRSAVGVDALKFATCMKVPSTQRKDCGDYQQIAGEVTFAAGETSKLVTIPIMEDMCLEQWEKHFVVRLQVPGGEPLLGEDFIARCSKASAMEFAAKSSDEPEKELGPAELCTRLKTSLPIGTRHRTPLKKFPNCFSSVEAVNWMLEHKQARDKSEAVRKCQTLLSQRLIEQVDGPAEFEVNAKRFYRFKPAEAS